ncbi:MAG: ABC transporter ATP-binding protein [Acetobacteraceae bacterium]|nr:ABC transporter ATP-binding protein [Acetobacteraceae bacterium]
MPISEPEAPLLRVHGLHAGYGKVGVLHGVEMDIRAGELVTLLGPNGAGKTTLLRAISGLLPWDAGEIGFGGSSLRGVDPGKAGMLGLVHVIEGHRVFTQSTVTDNLLLAGYHLPRGERAARVEEALGYFPEIAEKRHALGGALSGGQQQMLAVAQGLVRQPKLLMLDEPSAGLSPVLVDRVFSVLARLRDKGVAVLLVEQLIEKALAVADRLYALSQGRIVMTASAQESDLPARLERAYFGVNCAPDETKEILAGNS